MQAKRNDSREKGQLLEPGGRDGVQHPPALDDLQAITLLAQAAARFDHVQGLHRRPPSQKPFHQDDGRFQHQQRVLVTDPLEFVVEDGVEFHAVDAARLAGGRITDPQLHAAVRGVGKRELRPVRRPQRPVRARVFRQFDGGLPAA